jgi:sarcosine oxidase, subunit beta
VPAHCITFGDPESKNVILLERDALSSGSTSKSAGGIRCQFADELNIRIALRSLDEFEHFEELTGAQIDFRQTGYLFLISTQDDLESFRTAIRLQQSLGVESQELTVSQALQIVPQIDPEGLVGAAFCHRDGHATPDAVVYGYAAGSSGSIRTGCPATGIRVRGDRIVAVETAQGRIATEIVVCTAGVWSVDVARMIGLELPVRGERRFMWFSPQNGGLSNALPLTIDYTTGFYIHREGPGVVFGGRSAELENVAAEATRRLPMVAEFGIASSWWGYYDISPDWNALVGEAHSPGRFLYATGFSGHGFQQAPAVGEHLAALVIGRRPSLDLSPFTLDRFHNGHARPEAFVV